MVRGGEVHNCGATATQDVYCWGRNNYGQLGDGTKINSLTPVKVQGLPAGTIQDLSLGFTSSCAVINGNVWCWGQFPKTTGVSQMTSVVPFMLSGLSNVVSVGVRNHGCALLGDGSLKCWGYNYEGEVGNGTWGSYFPLNTVFASGATRLAVGRWHNCALVSGNLYCWGSATSRAMGVDESTFPPCAGNLSNCALSPHLIPWPPGFQPFEEISAGFTCGRTPDKKLWCWGKGGPGNLGDGNFSSSYAFVQVSGLSNVGAFSTSSLYHVCAVDSGKLYCWGSNGAGEAGIGAISGFIGAPKPVNLPVSVVEVETGGIQVCAREAVTNHVSCWGGNQFGQGGGATSSHPVCDDPNTSGNIPCNVNPVLLMAP
jgi:alpha-tubulin suppressor-like RCC1 family protein